MVGMALRYVLSTLAVATAMVVACAEGIPTPQPVNQGGGGGTSQGGAAGSSSGGFGGSHAGGGGSSGTCEGVADGSPCGDSSSSDCDAPDSCANGSCSNNFAHIDVPCGDAADSDCLNPDICDGAGTCLPNDEVDGTSCNDCPSGSDDCAGCDAGVCQDACVPPPLSLQTGFQGSSERDGYMFDVVAKTDLTITSVDVNLKDGTHDLWVYYRDGSHVGHEVDPNDWALVGSAANVASNGSGVPTPVPITLDLPMLNGKTLALYVTSSSSTMRSSHASNPVGNVTAENGDMQLLLGVGIDYAFVSIHGTRRWNGIVRYFIGCP